MLVAAGGQLGHMSGPFFLRRTALHQRDDVLYT